MHTAVRSQKSVASIKAAPSVQPYLKDLEFAIVQDIVKEGAYDRALQNVVYVLHIASSLPGQASFFTSSVPHLFFVAAC